MYTYTEKGGATKSVSSLRPSSGVAPGPSLFLAIALFQLTLGLGPLSGVSIDRLYGVGALWDCVPRVCGGGGGRRRYAAGGCARAVLVWGGVSRGYT